MSDDLNGSRRVADSIARFIRDVGFPIAVCAYLLLSLGPKLDRLSENIQRLVIIAERK